jgi:hypothetical protein
MAKGSSTTGEPSEMDHASPTSLAPLVPPGYEIDLDLLDFNSTPRVITVKRVFPRPERCSSPECGIVGMMISGGNRKPARFIHISIGGQTVLRATKKRRVCSRCHAEALDTLPGIEDGYDITSMLNESIIGDLNDGLTLKQISKKMGVGTPDISKINQDTLEENFRGTQ